MTTEARAACQGVAPHLQTTVPSSAVEWTLVLDPPQSCGGLSENVPYRLRCLNMRSQVGGAYLGRFRKCGPPGGRMSLGAGSVDWTFPGHSLRFLLVVRDVSSQFLLLLPPLCHDGLLALWKRKPGYVPSSTSCLCNGVLPQWQKSSSLAGLLPRPGWRRIELAMSTEQVKVVRSGQGAEGVWSTCVWCDTSPSCIEMGLGGIEKFV